ncbi:tRNA (N6-threonylcarbamoyladenosine(37)-N6)-methyltransferase TrmO [Brenneria populi subsp. brevivirga]|nr:tRNA (N6-threonylcarbamoyladenosine(37)-N6)-methyltransferase TrmO [Brenneria populi subsp. brevivirga]
MKPFLFNQIGVIRSPYKEKFAIPRQPGLIEDGGGELRLLPPYNQAECVRGLSDFSHIWILFVFHQTMEGGWRPTVRPPRLGGNARMGVFATRSTFRPNPIGMSLVELKAVHVKGDAVTLALGSLDLVDGTPVVDIKPYLPFAESQPHARAGFAQSAPEAAMPVVFSPLAERQIAEHQKKHPRLKRFITQVLAQDPRPAYRQGEESEREYAVLLLEFNVRWRVSARRTEVLCLETRETNAAGDGAP